MAANNNSYQTQRRGTVVTCKARFNTGVNEYTCIKVAYIEAANVSQSGKMGKKTVPSCSEKASLYSIRFVSLCVFHRAKKPLRDRSHAYRHVPRERVQNVVIRNVVPCTEDVRGGWSTGPIFDKVNRRLG